MRRQSVLLVDDRIVFTETMVRRLCERFDVLGAMTDPATVLQIAGTLQPDAIVLDVAAGARSLDTARCLLAAREDRRILLLAAEGDLRLAPEALRLGVRGIVLKPSTGEELVAALDAVLAGNRFLPAALTGELLAASAPPAEPTGARPLNANQREILRLLSDGLRMKEIAEHLQLSPRTVETLKHELMRRLGIQSTPELVRYAVDHKLVPF